MKIRRATPYMRRAAQQSARLLADALTCARVAQCPKLIIRIEAAVSSAGGAVRHIERRLARTRPVMGVLHVTNSDRRAFAAVDSPKRGFWFKSGQYA